MKVRPLQDQLIIKLDKAPEKKGIILLGSGEERLRTGTIERMGPGSWITGTSKRAPFDVEKGMHVAFFRENFETIQGKEVTRIVAELEPGTVMIRARDLLYAFLP